MSKGKPTYIGIDLETTGKDYELDPNENVILEVAVVILDHDLVELDRWSSTIDPEYPITEMCNDHVLNIHRSTGLIDADGIVTGERILLHEAELTIMRLVNEHFAQHERPVLLGHSIQFERKFLAVHMPHLAVLLHYRQLDARVVELLAPELDWGKAHTKHRALDDILHSVAVLRKGRERLLASEYPKNITPLIQQRVVDILYLYTEDVSDRVRNIVLSINEGDYAAAQAMAEHAEELGERQPQLVYYLQGLRDAGAYPLQRARMLLEGARNQCESIRQQWMKAKSENDLLRKHLRDAQEEIDLRSFRPRKS